VVVTIIVTIAILAILVFLVVWGFGLVVQWLINNTDRLQTLYSQATEWLDGHGISIATLVADNYSPGWVTCGRRLGKNFLTFCSIGRVRSRVRPVCAADVAAGPNALRGSGPNR
jgi:predicted PurR-regulated permease PerM